MASRKEGSGAAGGGFGSAKGKGKAAAAGDSAVKQVQIDGLVSAGPGASAGGRGAGGAAAWSRRRGPSVGRCRAEPRVLPGSALPEGQERLPIPVQLPGCGPVLVPGEGSASRPL